MTPPPPPPAELAGLPDDLLRALAGKYEVERSLGAGGMGTVYLARDLALDRLVAIKVVSPELTTSSVIRDRFLQEARTVARLRHPNIVAVHAAGEAGGLLYFVMEYVPGESLHTRLDRVEKMDGHDALTTIRDLANALAYAHERGIVHRDVKPDNILLDQDKKCAMLTDFGVARALSTADERLTRTGFVLGSPRYMSPEQAAGERELDGRSDVYSLALVAYEMFAGEPAFTGTGAQAVLTQQLTQTPAPLEEKSDTVPPDVALIISRALAKDPAERPDAAELAAVLDDVLTGERFQHQTRTSARRARGGAATRRRRRMIVGGAVALVGLAMVAGALTNRDHDGIPQGVDPRRSYLVTPFDVQGSDPQISWLREASVNMLTLDFAQWKDLNVVDYEHTLDLLRDAKLDGEGRVGLEDARRLARHAGVWSVVMGQVTPLGDSLLVLARVYDVASGKQVDQAQRSTARTSDPRPLYDAIARDLLDLVGAPPTSVSLTATTTASVAAYRAYLEGLRALNGWQLPRADSLFHVATDADSTFALAYYKRALTLGWRAARDSTQFDLLRHAADHADRLPERERELLSAYTDLIRSLHAPRDVTAQRLDTLFRSAQRKYEAIVTRNPSDAEAWYGLGDAYWHHRPNDAKLLAANWTRAYRAFNRTLALDSSFHLAYSHTLDIYRQVSSPASYLVLNGDSLLLLDTEQSRHAFGEARIAQTRTEAKRRALRDARAWASADAAPQAYMALVNAYIDAGFVDSAAITVGEAQRRASSRSPLFPYVLATAQANTDPRLALQTLRDAMREFPAESIAAHDGTDRVWAVLNAGDAATIGGSLADLRKLGAVAAKAEPKMPGPDLPTSFVVSALSSGAEMGMGVPAASVRPRLDSAVRYIDRYAAKDGDQLRRMAVALPYVAYLATRDTTYLATLRRWWNSGGAATPIHEIDALAALDRGDRESALRSARLFPSADSTRAAGAFINAMRWVTRAEVAARLGDDRRALSYYELLDPSRFSRAAPLDPGWPLYARSLVARGALYEKVGEKDRAIASYRQFLDLWRDADPVLDGQRRSARDAIARLGGEVPTETTTR
ncbi:MAG TPA: serine/threonine-protein kinase [Gemmatimonadaceae bacterium]|nr:serine/threonine-protein kinase [Gemmatimonadaceae bacterium]